MKLKYLFLHSRRHTALVLATISTGLAAGFFYSYDVSVTRGLAVVDDGTYVATMQAINATVRNIPFALSFYGALVLSALALALTTRARDEGRAATWLVGAGFALYAVAFVVTFVVNVPLNEGLATANVAAADLHDIRKSYETPWTFWNRVRTLAAIAGFACLATALQFGGRRAEGLSAKRRYPRPS